MAAIVTNKFRLYNAEQFYESFSEANQSFYLFVGRPQPWTSTTPYGGGSDTQPPTPLDNVNDEFMYFRDMLAAKRIAAADINYAIPRHNWTAGTIYDYYRGDYGAQWSSTATDIVKTQNNGTNLWASTTLFYVLSSTNNVYMCVSNNNGAAVAAGEEPTGTSNVETTTADGYVWKYMYTLTTTDITDFLTADFMPVRTNATVSAAAIDGAVNQYKIMRAGAGYTNGTFTAETLRGDGSGGTCSVTISAGSVTAVTITGTPTGYSFAYVRVADINAAGGGSLSGTEIDVIIEPKGGHGSDPFEELGAYFVILNTSFEGAETANSGDFATQNDFRRVCLMRDPKSGGSAASATTLRGTKAILVTSPSGNYTVEWDASDFSSGIYFVKMISYGIVKTHKIMLIK